MAIEELVLPSRSVDRIVSNYALHHLLDRDLARGPAGWWRIAKNAWRLIARTAERPIPIRRWLNLMDAAGLVDRRARRIVAEAAVVSGQPA